jgi:IPT/TIG domain
VRNVWPRATPIQPDQGGRPKLRDGEKSLCNGARTVRDNRVIRSVVVVFLLYIILVYPGPSPVAMAQQCAPEVLSTVIPASASETGDTPITITGSGFTCGGHYTTTQADHFTQVWVGWSEPNDGYLATNVQVSSDTELTADTPAWGYPEAGPLAVSVWVAGYGGYSGTLSFTETGTNPGAESSSYSLAWPPGTPQNVTCEGALSLQVEPAPTRTAKFSGLNQARH